MEDIFTSNRWTKRCRNLFWISQDPI